MSHSLSRRSSLLVLFALSLLSACNPAKSPAETAAPPTTGVEPSYQALAQEFAACGEKLNTCIDDADSRAARFECRADFVHCRRDAGKQAVREMIAAIHACVDTAKQCKHAGDDDAGIVVNNHECKRQLWSCIWHRGDAGEDADAGAGSDDDGDECIKRLHHSLWRGHSPRTCAGHVRECVADAMPEPDDVVPDDEDPQTPSDPGEVDSESADAGAASGGSGGSSASGGSSGSAGHGGGPVVVHGRACLFEYGVCLRQRHGVRACVERLRKCAHPGGR